MRYLSVAVASVAFLILAGCLSRPRNDEIAERECVYLGLTFGTPDYAACYQRAMARLQAADASLIDALSEDN